MNKRLEEDAVHVKGSVQRETSRCLFGDWPRREVLKLALPVKDWPLSLQACQENMSTDTKVF